MTTATAVGRASIAQPRSLFAPDAREAPRRTLEAKVLATLDERRLRGSAPCVVCGESTDAAGVCRSCGSELS